MSEKIPFLSIIVQDAELTLRILNVTLHILRHTYATRLEEGNIQPKLKQYLLGHSSLAVTQNIYTDTTTEYLESVSERVQNVFCGI